jgi:hypothetical protein
MSTLQYQLERNRKLLKNQKLSNKLYENAAMKMLGAEGQTAQDISDQIDLTSGERPEDARYDQQFADYMYNYVKDMPFIQEMITSQLSSHEIKEFVVNINKYEPFLQRLQGKKIDKQSFLSTLHDQLEESLTKKINTREMNRNLVESGSSSISELKAQLVDFFCNHLGVLKKEIETKEELTTQLSKIFQQKVNEYFETTLMRTDDATILGKCQEYAQVLNDVGIDREETIKALVAISDHFTPEQTLKWFNLLATKKHDAKIFQDMMSNPADLDYARSGGDQSKMVMTAPEAIEALRRDYNSQSLGLSRQHARIGPKIKQLNNYNLIKLNYCIQYIGNGTPAQAGQSKTGHGLGDEKIEITNKHQIIGPAKQYYINREKLGHGILSMRYMKNRHLVNDLREQPISHEVRRCIEDEIDGRGVNATDYHRLGEKDKNLLRFFMHKVGSNKRFDDDDGMMSKLQICLGEIEAGNDNPKIKRELRELLIYASKRGIISRNKCFEYFADYDL